MLSSFIFLFMLWRQIIRKERTREFFLFITQTTIFHWCPARLCPSRSLLRSLQMSHLDLFLLQVSLVGILFIELGKHMLLMLFATMWKYKLYRGQVLQRRWYPQIPGMLEYNSNFYLLICPVLLWETFVT